MDINNKVAKIEKYMDDSEFELKTNFNSYLDNLVVQKYNIEKKYDLLKDETIRKCQFEKNKILELCNQAKELVQGIRRKLFKKGKNNKTNIQADEIKNPEYILENLETEINKFESSSLPYGIRQFFDNILLFFNSNYGQDEINKINALYQSLIHIQESGELDEKLNNKLYEIEQDRKKEISSIDRKLSVVASKLVDDYIYDLKIMMLTN